MSGDEMQDDNRSASLGGSVDSSSIITGTGNATITITNYYYRKESRVLPVESTDAADDNLPCPYRGLFHFGPYDAEYFFGREVFIKELFEATQSRNFIPLLGASGSGKSSVVLAGLVPKLQNEGHWLFTHFRPGSAPFYALAEALVPLYTTGDSTVQIAQARALARYFHDDKVTLPDILSHIQRKHPNHRVLLIADQFEELYTLCQEQKIRRRFLDTLLTSFQSSPSQSQYNHVLVATMRADFLGNALEYPAFRDVLTTNTKLISSMNHDQLKSVISKPAQKLGVTFELGLVERILDDVEHEPGNLPLLEFALTELWKQRKGKLLTHAAYEAIGKVQGALARHADENYHKLSVTQQEQVRRIFIQLVRPGEGTEDTRRLATKDELGEASWGLVEQLADKRLVVTNQNAANQETVEIAHKALISNWGELRLWMNENRNFRVWQEQLRLAMYQWEQRQRDEGALLQGSALKEAEEKLKQRPQELTIYEREFIERSIRKAEGIVGSIKNIWKRFTGGNRQPEEKSQAATVETKVPEEVASVSSTPQQNLEVVKTYAWYPNLKTHTKRLSVGQDLTLTLSFTPGSQSNTESLRIPVNTLEITVYIEAPGFLLQGEHTRTLPVWDGKLMESNLNLQVTPLISGDHTIHISIYPGGQLPNLKPIKLEKKVNINKPKKLPLMRELIDHRTIPDPQPDVILHVTLEESDKQQSTGEQHIGLYLTCAALELDRKPLEHLQFTANDLKILQQLTIQAAAVANGSPVDALKSLRAIGATLFDKLIPLDSQLWKHYCELINLANMTPNPLSWLVISEAKAVLPWELICAYDCDTETGENWYDEFLGERFIVAHWVGYQGLKLANEVPLLELGLTHYNQYPEQLSRWQKVLGSETEKESNQHSGLVALMQPSSLCYGLHILRYTDCDQTGQITSYQENLKPAPGKTLDRAEELLYNQQLDFTLRRPVVGLSLVADQPNRGMGMFVSDNQLEANWMLPLMHAGASALVGSRWSTLPESDRLFYRTFYNLIRTGTELGWAVWQARKEVKDAFPHRSDWLAYTYFGHPQCQPYLVRPSEGFTFFEAINPPENDCFEAGKSYQFRASYRKQAPVWYKGRLHIAQNFIEQENLSVTVMSTRGILPKTYQLEPIENGDSYQCIVTLTMPKKATKRLPAIINFQQGDEELRSLILNLKVVAGEQG